LARKQKDTGDFFHVRELALPAPGSHEQLSEQVARIVARPLDRSRPLWELYLISRLESGHVAILMKIHHAVVDGISGAEITGLLLDLAPTGRELPPRDRRSDDESTPGLLGVFARALPGGSALPGARVAIAAGRGPESPGDAVQRAAGSERPREGRQAVRARDH
jgi:diacylglycerol O-acyltransferase / wax synthase